MLWFLVGVVVVLVVLFYPRNNDEDAARTRKFVEDDLQKHFSKNPLRSTGKKKKEIRIKGEALNPDDDDVDSYIFEVVGESFNNDDGSSRQKIIEQYVKVGEPIYLQFYNYKGSLACKVFVDEALTLQIGHIASDDAADVYDLVTAGNQIDPRILSCGKASNGLYGVTITIMVKE